jgi:hypothetical protein
VLFARARRAPASSRSRRVSRALSLSLFDQVFGLCYVYSALQCIVAMYFVRGARVACGRFGTRLRSWRVRGREAGSSLSVAERHLHQTTLCLALSAVCMVVSIVGMILVGTDFFKGPPRNFVVSIALVAGGRVGTSLAQVKALDPSPSLVRWHESVSESPPEPGGARALAPRLARTPRSRGGSSASATPRTPRSDASDDAAAEEGHEVRCRMQRNLLSRGNLETHNYWLDAGLPVAHGRTVASPADAPHAKPPAADGGAARAAAAPAEDAARPPRRRARSPAAETRARAPDPSETATDSSDGGADETALSVVKVRVRPAEFEEVSLAVASGSTIGELRESARQCALMQQRQLRVIALEDPRGRALDDNMRVGRAMRGADGQPENVLTGRWGRLNPLK